MTEFPYMPFWVGKYLSKTHHLTTIEHGAYLLLLMASWQAPTHDLPDDDKLLARFSHLTARQWARIRPTLEPFFLIENGRWSNSRLTREVDAVRQLSKRQSQKAKARWLKEKETGNATAEPQQCPDDASHTHTHTHIYSDTNVSDADSVISPGTDEHSKLLFKLARQAGRASAPTELRKLGVEDLRIEMMLRTALQQAEPRSYLGGILTKRKKDGSSPDAHQTLANGAARAIARIQAEERSLADGGTSDEGATKQLPGCDGGMAKTGAAR